MWFDLEYRLLLACSLAIAAGGLFVLPSFLIVWGIAVAYVPERLGAPARLLLAKLREHFGSVLS